MDQALHRHQIDQSDDAFQRALASVIVLHRDQFVLMRDRSVNGFYANAGEAYRARPTQFDDGLFSVQEVTDQPIDLGFHSFARGD